MASQDRFPERSDYQPYDPRRDDELGVPYKYHCTADHPTDPSDICPNEAITPIEVDGSMYCEDHMEQSDASRYLKKKGEA